MSQSIDDFSSFRDRFVSREQAERYRDRFRTGRRKRIDHLERRTLRRLLDGIGPLSVALDIPAGTGRLAPLLAQVADRVLLADGSPTMLEVAREGLSGLEVECLETDVRCIALETGSVDLVLCHRFLHHIHDAEARARILSEFARVSRQYVIISYYTPGFRDQWRWLRSRVIPGARRRDRPATSQRFFKETARASLCTTKIEVLRRFPLTALFCLFQRP